MISETSRNRVLRNLRNAAAERLTHPVVISDEEELGHISDKISKTLEEFCYETSEGDEYLYKSLVSEFFAHISPYFYSARHSLIFRDMLFRETFSRKGRNPCRADKSYLWPEIYKNNYLNQKERIQIVEIRQFEVAVAAQFVDVMVKSDDIVMVMDEVAKKHTFVSIGDSQDCWKPDVNEVNVSCDPTDGLCGLRSLRKDVPYEIFMLMFAKQGMQGPVPDPRDEDEELDENVTRHVRDLWSKEIKMCRIYLDIMTSISN